MSAAGMACRSLSLLSDAIFAKLKFRNIRVRQHPLVRRILRRYSEGIAVAEMGMLHARNGGRTRGRAR